MTTTSRFARFLLTSGIAALLNVLARYEFSRTMPYEAAVAAAFPIGVVTAYVLARAFVFEPATIPVRQQLTRITIVNLAALVIVWTVSVGLARFVFPLIGWSWHAEDLAHVIGVASPALFSYASHQRYSFQREEA